MKEKLNIEQLFKTKLGGLEETPSPGLWEQTSRLLKRRQFLRFNPRRFNIFYTAGIIISGTLLTLILVDTSAPMGKGGEIEQTEVSQQEKAVVHSSTPDQPYGAGTTEQANSSVSIESGKLSATGKGQIADNDIQKKEVESQVPKKTNEIRTIDQRKRELIQPEPVNTLIAYFTPSVYEGCAPLEVNFTNSSVNATGYSWNVGTGQQVTTIRQPAALYTEAGQYAVTLVARDKNGMEQSHTELITVHPRPTAEFELEDGRIYNYSVGATEYKWIVTANGNSRSYKERETVSTDFQPDLNEILIHEASNLTSGASLMLITKNSTGCSDTVTAPLILPPSPTLLFPNAFSPNPGGGTGGHYNPNEPVNRVFYPKYNELPVTYNLKIYNKAGETIFETNDITIGWDGYHKEAPAPRGVYIYRCSGTWNSGEPFTYRGDITILWNDL